VCLRNPKRKIFAQNLKIFRGGRPVLGRAPVRRRPHWLTPPPFGPDVFDGWSLNSSEEYYIESNTLGVDTLS